MRSPCIENDCAFKDADKNRPECLDCADRKDYVLSMGGPSRSVPLQFTEFGGRMKTYKKWTFEDETFLRDNYQAMTNRQMGEHLHRKARNVSTKLNNMNLKRDRNLAPGTTVNVGAPDPDRKLTDLKRREDFFILDFTPYPNLYNGLIQLAERNFRSPENQIFALVSRRIHDAEMEGACSPIS